MQQHPLDVAYSWLIQSAADLDTAKYLLDGQRYDAACFTAQQTAEKALKAVLIWLAGDKPRTHVIAELLKQVGAHQDLPPELRDLRMLDTFYVSSRYPDALGGASPTSTFVHSQAESAVMLAAAAVDFAMQTLPPNTPPSLE